MNEIRCGRCRAITDGRRCKNCKKNEYYRNNGERIDTPCKNCEVISKLCSNGTCRTCLQTMGLKECSACRDVLPALLFFKKKQGVCNRCRHPLAHLTPTERALHRVYMKKYGIGYEEFLTLSDAQQQACAICRTEPANRLVVDHDHDTREIRGLLCTQCNVGLGMFKDSPDRLAAAVEYLGGVRPAGSSEPRQDPRRIQLSALQKQLHEVEVELESLQNELKLEKRRHTQTRKQARVLDANLFFATIRWMIDLLEQPATNTEGALKWLRAQQVRIEKLITSSTEPSAPAE